MLVRSSVLFAALLVPVLAVAGCTIKSVDTDNDIETGGSGPTAGQGGDTSTGAGGAGGGGTTTGPTCIGEEGTGVTADSCDAMNITPESAGGAQPSICEDDEDGGILGASDPLGWGTCHRAFDIYTAGAAEQLQACLGGIGAGPDACDPSLVQACIDDLYAEVCDRSYVADTCDAIASQCGTDPFDAETCVVYLRPFSDAGLTELVDCINATDASIACQPAFDDCFATVTTF